MALINGREYQYSDITVFLGGARIGKLRGIEYGEKFDRELLYGKGNEAQSIQSGNTSAEGKIMMLASDHAAIKTALGGTFATSQFDIVVVYGDPSKGVATTTTRIEGCMVTEDKVTWKQGDKFAERELPFLALKIKEGI